MDGINSQYFVEKLIDDLAQQQGSDEPELREKTKA
jgi:hypothetical protein